jgi:hypothetical protein
MRVEQRRVRGIHAAQSLVLARGVRAAEVADRFLCRGNERAARRREKRRGRGKEGGRVECVGDAPRELRDEEECVAPHALLQRTIGS